MSRHNINLPNILKRGFTSLLIFGVVLFPLYSTAHLAYGFYNGARDSRKVGTVPAFQPRAYDQNMPLRPFKQPIITVTFDDGWESVYTDALPLLQKYGIRTTQYVLSGPIDDQAYVSPAQVQAMENAGHEIGCHGVLHLDLVTLGENDLERELTECQNFYSNLLGHPIDNFASPYSSENAQTLATIAKHYKSQRNTFGDTVDGMEDYDINLPMNYKEYSIMSLAIRDTTTLQEIQSAVNYAIATNGWLVLTYHQLDESQKYGVNTRMLEEQLAYISQAPVRTATVGDVINTLHGNKGEY